MMADVKGGESTCSCVDSGEYMAATECVHGEFNDVSNWQDCGYSVDEIEDAEFGDNDWKTGFKSGELADMFSLGT